MNYFTKWKIKVNPTKPTVIQFSKRKKRIPDPIEIDGIEIQWKNEMKYLGTTLDQKLTYKNHIEEVYTKAKRTRAILYPLINRNSSLSMESKITILKSIYIPRHKITT